MKFFDLIKTTLNEMAQEHLTPSVIKALKEGDVDTAVKEYEGPSRGIRNTIEQNRQGLLRGIDNETLKSFANAILPIKKTSTVNNQEGQLRTGSGGGFETKFAKKYEVSSAKELGLSHASVSIKMKGKSTHPAIKNFHKHSIDDYEFDSSVDNFHLLKGDFYSEGKLKERETDKVVSETSDNGNLFELKKYENKASVYIMYSEAKKLASRTSFIETFGTSANKKEWENSKDLSTKQKESIWIRIRKDIKNNSMEAIQKHNEVIEFIKDSAIAFVNENKQLISQGIRNDLAGKSWFLVLKKGNDFDFNQINVDNFVNDLRIDQTHWQGIKRVRLQISDKSFIVSGENSLKESMVNLSEFKSTVDTKIINGLEFSFEVEIEGEIDIPL